MKNIQEIYDILHTLPYREQKKALRAWRRLRAQTHVEAKAWSDLEQKVRSAQTQMQARQAFLESVDLCVPETLPVYEKQTLIREALQKHRTVILTGETGSGKTTQIPKIALQAGFAQRGCIAHTQPRRIAARAVSERLNEECQKNIASYKVRFHDDSHADTYLKVMTDGILLQEMHHDPLLQDYSLIILDEVHERSLNIDFLIGSLKLLQEKRPDLTLILTSATLDVHLLQKHFPKAPHIAIEGRSYPVSIRYAPCEEGEEPRHHFLRCLEACLRERPSGDVLAFFPSEADILEAVDWIRKAHHLLIDALPLYGRMSLEQQHHIFKASARRKVICSTNVAETSLTVPNIVAVLDLGTARIARYNHRTRVQSLQIEPISQASAQQRAGRAGRVMPGIAYRLYEEEDFQSREAYTPCEIQRTPLASVILKMAALKLGDPLVFPFLEPPEPAALREGQRMLERLQALDTQHRLTSLGRQMAALPLEPQASAALCASTTLGCSSALIVLCAAMSVVDPRERPLQGQEHADRMHAQWRDPRSDFISDWNLYCAYARVRATHSKRALRTWCEEHFLSWRRMQEWQDVIEQLCRVMAVKNLDIESPIAYESVHTALLKGWMMQVGRHLEKGLYQAPLGRKMSIFPGSSSFGRNPSWILCAHIVHTKKIYARHVAAIEPAWLIRACPHLLSEQVFSPHFDPQRQQVSGTLKQSFFGIPVQEGRAIFYGTYDLDKAHDVFIEEALVGQQIRVKHPFVQANADLMQALHDLEIRARTADLVPSLEQRIAFFKERLGEQRFADTRSFERWMRAHEVDLCYPKAWLEDAQKKGEVDKNFPEQWHIGDACFDVHYHFDVHHSCDGITIILPFERLRTLPLQALSWHLPAYTLDRVIALMNSLPKVYRRRMTPTLAFAKAFLEEHWTRSTLSLEEALRIWIEKRQGVALGSFQWDLHAIEHHLNPTYRVMAEGKVRLESMDIEAVLALRDDVAYQVLDGEEVQAWPEDFVALQTHEQQGVKGYAALYVQEGRLFRGLIDHQEEAERSHQEAVYWLLEKMLEAPLSKALKKYPLSWQAQACWPQEAQRSVQETMTAFILRAAREKATDLPCDGASWEALLRLARTQIDVAALRAQRALEAAALAQAPLSQVIQQSTLCADEKAYMIQMMRIDAWGQGQALSYVERLPLYHQALEKCLRDPHKPLCQQWLQAWRAWVTVVAQNGHLQDWARHPHLCALIVHLTELAIAQMLQPQKPLFKVTFKTWETLWQKEKERLYARKAK